MAEDNNTNQKDTSIDTSSMKMPSQKLTHSHLGPVLGILLILLVIVAVGLYLWGAQLTQNKSATTGEERTIANNEPETPRAVADMQIYGTLSPSNEVAAIDADVSSTNLDSLDTDISTIEQELNNSLKVK